MKRYLVLVIIVLVIAGLLIGGYFLRKNSSTSQTPTGQGSAQIQNQALNRDSLSGMSTGQNLLGVLAQKSNQVAPNLVKDYFVDAQGKVTFIQPDGQIFSSIGEVANDETPKTINSTAIDGLIDASFSSDGKMVAARFGNPENPQTSILDIDGKTWRPLELSIQSLAWSPKSRQIAYLAKTNKGLALGTLDLSQNKSKPKEAIFFHAEDLNLAWVGPEKVMITEKASAKIKSSVWAYDFNKKTLASFIRDRLGLETIWNASGTLALELSGGQLKLIDAQGVAASRFDFVTIPSKCAFSFSFVNATTTSISTGTKKTAAIQPVKEEYLNCAIPKNASQLSGRDLPDDYYMKDLFTEDNIYQIKISGGEVASLFTGEGVDATNLKRVGQKIYFINRFDNKLYSVSIAGN